jgi:hypothetical protein
VVDFYDRGRGVEVDPFLRAWKRRECRERKIERFPKGLWRVLRSSTRNEKRQPRSTA